MSEENSGTDRMAVDNQISFNRSHVEKFIEELEIDHLKWYEKQQGRHYTLWIVLEVTSVAAPLLTTIFSGIASAYDLFGRPWVKCVVTVLPALAVASSSMLARLGVREMENSRERGRQDFEILIRNARLELQCTAESQKLVELHRKLIAEAARIDAEQHDAHHHITAAVSRRKEGHITS